MNKRGITRKWGQELQYPTQSCLVPEQKTGCELRFVLKVSKISQNWNNEQNLLEFPTL